MEKQSICQSCSMPMREEADFGTNADGSKNQEY
ncbi:MAG: zinc ribbon domain-containing protein, partial [Candidatus Margulisiibacteriota bacterium]